MAHVIPTLRSATHPTYIPPAMQRKSDIPASTGNPASATDFGTELKNQTGTAATADGTDSTHDRNGFP